MAEDKERDMMRDLRSLSPTDLKSLLSEGAERLRQMDDMLGEAEEEKEKTGGDDEQFQESQPSQDFDFSGYGSEEIQRMMLVEIQAMRDDLAAIRSTVVDGG